MVAQESWSDGGCVDKRVLGAAEIGTERSKPLTGLKYELTSDTRSMREVCLLPGTEMVDEA